MPTTSHWGCACSVFIQRSPQKPKPNSSTLWCAISDAVSCRSLEDCRETGHKTLWSCGYRCDGGRTDDLIASRTRLKPERYVVLHRQWITDCSLRRDVDQLLRLFIEHCLCQGIYNRGGYRLSQ